MVTQVISDEPRIKPFHFPLLKVRCCWVTGRQRQQGLRWLVELPLPQLPLLCLESKLSIINPLLRLNNLQQVFKPSPSSVCLNHHALKCSTSGCWWQTNCSGSCTAVQRKQQPATVYSSAAPNHANQSFHSPCRLRKQLLKLTRKNIHFPCLVPNSSPVSYPWGQWDFKQNAPWMLLHTSVILQFGENFTFTGKKTHHVPGFRTITENKNHWPLVQKRQGFSSLDSALHEVPHNRVTNQSVK